MKKLFFILFLALCIAGGVILSGATRPSANIVTPRTITTSQQPTVQSTVVQSSVSIPKSISIPTLSVKSEIESVGLDKEGRIDTPKDVYNTGWYALGVKPGEKGSAVIDGHLDTPEGKPSVFFKLKSLKEGDTIEIESEDNKTYTFKVYDVVDYPLETIPMGKIVEATNEKRLNLITCGGDWDKEKKLYSERTVVYAKMIE